MEQPIDLSVCQDAARRLLDLATPKHRHDPRRPYKVLALLFDLARQHDPAYILAMLVVSHSKFLESVGAVLRGMATWPDTEFTETLAQPEFSTFSLPELRTIAQQATELIPSMHTNLRMLDFVERFEATLS